MSKTKYPISKEFAPFDGFVAHMNRVVFMARLKTAEAVFKGQ